MRSAITLACVLVLAAVPAAAQSFSQEFDDITTLAGAGWAYDNNSTSVGSTSWAPLTEKPLLRPGGEFQGNTAIFAQNTGTGYIGDNYNATTGASTISDWLLTPAVTMMNGDTLSFWTRTATPGTTVYPDRLQVRLSTNGASVNCGTLPEDVGDFTTLLLDINPTLTSTGYPSTWTQYTITLAGLTGVQTGRFAFRYYVTNGGPSGANSNYIGVDTLVFTSATPVELQSLQVD